MTYLQFHLIFILPVIFLECLIFRRILTRHLREVSISLFLMSAVAVVYTTPWDNFLVAKGVWGYPLDRVLFTIGYVPIEEYGFFVLQTILTGLWSFWLFYQQPPFEFKPSLKKQNLWGGTLSLLVMLLGIFLLQFDSSFYFGLILSWAAPVSALQWYFGGWAIFKLKKTWLLGVFVPTFYLCLADRMAIGLNIWNISEKFTTGWHILGLPAEEATFFLIANVMVVQGLILFWLWSRERRSARVISTGSNHKSMVNNSIPC